MSLQHLLVTNDFLPRIGGIQSYLWELWRRLPAENFAVFTRNQPGAAEFDRSQDFRVERFSGRVVAPSKQLRQRLTKVIEETDPSLVLYDPVFPAGLLGSQLGVPYGLVLHGAEISVPGSMPFLRRYLRRTLEGASLVITASRWAEEVARKVAPGMECPVHYIPPGVDTQRFAPLDRDQKNQIRAQFGIEPTALLVLGLSRLVPRKGMDVLIKAAGRLSGSFPDLRVAIAGTGRDQSRLQSLVERTEAPARLLGEVLFEQLPGLYGCADVFAMLCRNRWGGLEQEGFGIVFLEAAAVGIPQLAGASGGAAEAVVHGSTGLVVDKPSSVDEVTDGLGRLLGDPVLRQRMGSTARSRSVEDFSYDRLAQNLADILSRAV